MFGTDDDRVAFVLGLWREEWGRAGKPMQEGLEGRNAVKGASIIATNYLAAARMTVDQLRGGMREIIRLIQTDEKCHRYDLRTLANNPDKYVPASGIIPKSGKKTRRLRIRLRRVRSQCRGAVPGGRDGRKRPPMQHER